MWDSFESVVGAVQVSRVATYEYSALNALELLYKFETDVVNCQRTTDLLCCWSFV